jgi:hypothetical protein
MDYIHTIRTRFRTPHESNVGRRLVLLLALTFTAVGFGVQAVPAQAASFKTGVSLFDTISSGETAAAAKKIHAAGGSFDLVWLRWNEIAPAVRPDSWNPESPDDPNYNWTVADQWVTDSVKGGVTPLVQVYGAPSWANRCQAPAGLTVQYGAPCNPNPSDFGAFLKAAAKRYSGTRPGLPRVRYWQLQNEPNLHVFFNPQANAQGRPISPAIYRNLLKAGYGALKSVDKSNLVVSAGLAPNKPRGTSSMAPLRFVRDLFCLNARNRPKANSSACRGGVPVDIFDMHPYTSGGPTHKAAGKGNIQMGNLRQLRNTLNAADRTGHRRGFRPRTLFWVTEMAWDSKAPDPGGVPMWLLKRWTSEAMFRSFQAGVSVFMWYSIRDRDPAGRPWNESDQSGLYFRGASIDRDRPKPILQAFKFPFVAFPKGRKSISVWGRTPKSQPGWVSIQRFQKGRWRKLTPAKAVGSGVFRRVIKIPNGTNRGGTVRAVFKGQKAVPFSLKKFKDRPARPFG